MAFPDDYLAFMEVPSLNGDMTVAIMCHYGSTKTWEITTKPIPGFDWPIPKAEFTGARRDYESERYCWVLYRYAQKWAAEHNPMNLPSDYVFKIEAPNRRAQEALGEQIGKLPGAKLSLHTCVYLSSASPSEDQPQTLTATFPREDRRAFQRVYTRIRSLLANTAGSKLVRLR